MTSKMDTTARFFCVQCFGQLERISWYIPPQQPENIIYTYQIVDHTECKLLNTKNTTTEIPFNQDMVEDWFPANWHCVTGFTIPIIAKDHASKCVKLLFKQRSVTSQKTWIFITVFITVKILGKLKYSEMWHYVA